MKTIINFLLALLCLSCSSGRNLVVQDTECKQPSTFFELNESENYFDVSIYKNELIKGNVVLKEDSLIKSELIDLGDREVTVIDTDKKRRLRKWKRYKNGLIKRFFVEYELGNTKVGNQLEFDEKGVLVNTVNHDTGYSICWFQAIAIVKRLAKSDIKKYKLDTFYVLRNNLVEFPDAPAEWRVAIEGNEFYAQDGSTFYIIDGNTGTLKRKIKSKTVVD